MTVDNYIDEIEGEILNEAAEWLETGKTTSEKLSEFAAIWIGFLSNKEHYEEEMRKARINPYLCLPIDSKSAVLARLKALAIYVPLAKVVYERHQTDEVFDTQSPFMETYNRVLYLQAMAIHGRITRDFLQSPTVGRSVLSFEVTVSQMKPTDDLKKLMDTIGLYRNANAILKTLQERWKPGQAKRSWLGKGEPQVLVDYQLIADRNIGGFLDELKIERLETMRFEPLFSEYKEMAFFMENEIIISLFGAMLLEGVDPKSYKEAYQKLQKPHFIAGYIDMLLSAAGRRST